MILEGTNNKSDSLGALASGLCLVHCLATPFIFVAKTCSMTCCAAAPAWWGWLDYLFLVISFFAVYWSVRTTSKKWMKFAFWLSWFSLFFVIVNEIMEWVPLFKVVNYLPAVALIVLHVYNIRYCQCKEK